MKSLREQLFGPAMPLRDKLATANSTEAIKTEPKSEYTYTKPEPEAPVKFGLPGIDDGKLQKKVTPIKKLDQPFIGTNYDPYDPDQTKPEPDGIGKAMIKLDESMVATSLKEDGETGNLRLGTVIRVPALDNKLFLVADTMNKRFNGMNKIDFVAPNSKKKPDPNLNQNFEGIEIVREGQGAKDAREFVESGEWEKMKNGN